MPKVKSASEIAAKWARVASTRQADYESGIKDPDVNWEAGALGSKESYEQGIQEAIGRNAFTKGIERSGNEKWRSKAIKVGTGRWGPGIREGESDMAKGFEPFREVIERTVLPARGPRGDPRNMERATLMARALNEARLR